MRDLHDEVAPDVDGDPQDAMVLAPDSDRSERVLDALGSATTRAVLWALYESPATAPRLADRLDCSVQNAHYHLRKLESADLVRVAGHRYSEKGNEMDVYAPRADPVVVAGDTGTADRLRNQLTGAAVALLAGGGTALGFAVARIRARDGAAPPPTGPSGIDPAAGVDPVLVLAVLGAVAILLGARSAVGGTGG